MVIKMLLSICEFLSNLDLNGSGILILFVFVSLFLSLYCFGLYKLGLLIEKIKNEYLSIIEMVILFVFTLMIIPLSLYTVFSIVHTPLSQTEISHLTGVNKKIVINYFHKQNTKQLTYYGFYLLRKNYFDEEEILYKIRKTEENREKQEKELLQQKESIN